MSNTTATKPVRVSKSSRQRPRSAAPRSGELLSTALRRAERTSRAVLDGGERLQVLDALALALGGTYAHLPAKRAAYAGDPVQALVLLRRRAAQLTDAEFHLSLNTIVTSLRDAHTRYLGPATLRGQVAVLPFLAEQFGPDDAARFLVSKVNPEVVEDEEFVPGVELLAWNGIPFARAVELHAERETGGRPDARRARACESLTFRALDYNPPPDEHWVIVGYAPRRGRRREVRLPWRVLYPRKATTAATAGSRAALKLAADPAAEAVRRAKKLQFAPELWLADLQRAAAPHRADPTEPPTIGEWIHTPLQDVLAAKWLTAKVGYLRIWSFDVDDDDAFVAELIRLLALLPPSGLLVDLRANPGGLVWAAERALQLFTDATIMPTRFSLLATPVTRQMAESPFNRLELEPWSASGASGALLRSELQPFNRLELEPWSASLQDAVSTGELYAQPLPLTDPAWCNDLGRHYPGAAVAIVDANTYSSGDLFAAGWVDHGIGPLVCVGSATGAGGANVWTAQQLRDALNGTDHPLPALPDGTGFTVAFRRAIRSAAGDGLPIEDLGVAGIPYAMTRRDLLKGNRDLMSFCTGLLS